jgi:peptidoglycan/LPS O-acetylase OafA/YrhL
VNAGATILDRRPAQIPLLDALRGILAPVVLVAHCETTRIHLHSAALAVDFFMILSGFLMVHHAFLRETKEPIGTKRQVILFWLRRYFRIAPLYYLFLAMAFLFYYQDISVGTWSPIATALWHVSFLFGFVPDGGGSTMMPDWSIGLEMQFYMAFPFLAWLMWKIGLARFLLMCVVVTAACKHLWGVYEFDSPGPLGAFVCPTFLPIRISMFAMGMGVAWCYWRNRDWWILAIGCLVGVVGFERNHSFLSCGVVAGIALSQCNMTCARLFNRIAANLNSFSDKAFWRWAADMSYPVYLCHLMVIRAVQHRVDPHLGPIQELLSVVGLTLAGSFALAYAAHRLVELPLLALGKRVTHWVSMRLVL